MSLVESCQLCLRGEGIETDQKLKSCSVNKLWNYLTYKNSREASTSTSSHIPGIPRLSFNLSWGSSQHFANSVREEKVQICSECCDQVDKLDELHDHLQEVKKYIGAQVEKINQLCSSSRGSEGDNDLLLNSLTQEGSVGGTSLSGNSSGKENLLQLVQFLGTICESLPESTSISPPPQARQQKAVKTEIMPGNEPIPQLPPQLETNATNLIGGATPPPVITKVTSCQPQNSTSHTPQNPVVMDKHRISRAKPPEARATYQEDVACQVKEEVDEDDDIQEITYMDLVDPVNDSEFVVEGEDDPDYAVLIPASDPLAFEDDGIDQGTLPKIRSRKQTFPVTAGVTVQPSSSGVSVAPVQQLEATNDNQSDNPTSATGREFRPCRVCGKVIRSKNMGLHMRVHTGERPYECHICHKKFSQKNSLNVHRMIHTGEYPYPCELCDKKFQRQKQLRNHLFSAHGLGTIS